MRGYERRKGKTERNISIALKEPQHTTRGKHTPGKTDHSPPYLAQRGNKICI